MTPTKKTATKKAATKKPAVKKAASTSKASTTIKPGTPKEGDVIGGVMVNDAPAVVAGSVRQLGPDVWRVKVEGTKERAVVRPNGAGRWIVRNGA
jgi:hypothetical protein